jgi:hypothetical protein
VSAIIHRVVKHLALLLLSSAACGAGPLDDAARELARKVAPHLGAMDVARVTWKKESGVAAPPLAEWGSAQNAFTQAIRKRVRTPMPVDVTVTLSENVKGPLLIAEMDDDSGHAVEMVAFVRQQTPVSAPMGIQVEKRLVWEQEGPMLDWLAADDQLFVLDPQGLTRLERRDGRYQVAERALLALPVLRDLRGVLARDGDSLFADAAGQLCHGAWKPKLDLRCETGGGFLAGRNTLAAPDLPPHFSRGEMGVETLITEMDGRVHLYDSARKPLATFDGWGPDFAILSNSCARMKIVVAGSEDRSSSDTLTLYDVLNHMPARASDPSPEPGPVLSLASEGSSARAVVKNLKTGHYEAYSISVDCGR